MKQQEIITFFDRCAPTWDCNLVRKEGIIRTILDNAGIREGSDVLDIACGTGVLFPDYLARNVRSLTAIDISPEMVKIARSKFPGIQVLCGDVETVQFDHNFDAIMIYNAFPHFPEPERLIAKLAAKLRCGGRLSIAHSMSRAQVIHRHASSASSVSIELLPKDELAAILARYLEVDVIISNETMYQVCGYLK